MKDQALKVNLVAILIDIIDQLIIEMEPTTQRNVKFVAGRAIKQNKEFIKICDKIHGPIAESFGNDSDELREVIENHIQSKL